MHLNSLISFLPLNLGGRLHIADCYPNFTPRSTTIGQPLQYTVAHNASLLTLARPSGPHQPTSDPKHVMHLVAHSIEHIIP